MMRRAALGLAALSVATPLAAQVRPQPGPGDPHIQTVDYLPDQVVQIAAAPGYQVTIALAPDEQVVSVAVGDSLAWQASINRAGDRLFVKSVQPGVATNMTVITNVREYDFDLTPLPGPAADMAYTLRFHYPAPATASPPPPTSVAATYRLRGAKALRPSMIADDGVRTYIEWPADAALPAVYALDRDDHEMLTNGNMRGRLFVIDGVAGHLLFRIDARTAHADRRPVRAPR